ncbi:nascent polypeptide-associated complex subunit alpha, muscle-specific form-like [Penaeus indicus]|uniref:nascent polypeptide-associated complex subunit alpha, muscle-specific form-like n=1 Tax=Penaeus indicus TaxID=29960 RepID=UPI00300D39E1
MFGFFKNKSKDKDKDKDKQCDGGGAPKDKKREKITREEKNKEQRESTGRKTKEEKASKSIFRKSRSIEGLKEEGGGGGAGEKEEESSSSGSSGESRKSKTLDGRRSGGDWQQKQEEGERGPSTPKGSDNVDSPPPPLQPVAQSPRGSDGEGGAQSGREGGRGEEKERKGEKRGGTEGTEVKDEGIEKGQKEEREGKSEGAAPALYVRPTWRSPSTKPASAVESLVASRYAGYSRLGGTPGGTLGGTPWSTPGSTSGGTLSGTLGGSVQGSYLGSWRSDKTAATTKPPLNPRGTLSPKGPLAALTSPPAGVVVPEVVTTDRDDTSSPSPSPVVVTPPASPGLPGWTGGGGGGGVAERPVSPDGRASMLSTPSSSTSSLSSLAPARPISPSGRRTPPGPRMGTAGRLSSSPTPARKAQRPNIKTNPAAAGRRAGSRSPVGAVASSMGPSGAPDGEKLATPPPSPSSVRHQPSEPGVKAPASPPPVLRARTTVTPPSPEAARKQSVFPKLVPPSSPPLRASSTFSSHISPPPDARLAQRSVSPPNLAAGGKSRHSIVSMHSLESIPELDSDGHTSAADTLERKGAKVAAGTACGQAVSPTSRHSAPETAFPERHVPMGGVTGHKRSTSLTPVHEEKLSHSAKAPQVTLKAQVAPAPPRPRADEDVKLASGATEAATQQEAAKKDAKRVTPEDDKSIQHVRIEGKVAKDTRADLNAGWNRPTSPIETIEASETTTHVVIRIPLRRSASSGVIGEEKRVSIEFLPEQEKGSGRRLRSVSTPREFTREATHETFRDPKDSIGLARNRSLTGRRESRAEGKKDDSSDNGGRVRVRRRSSSRRRRDVISPGPAVEPKPPPPAPAQDANDGGDADDDSDPNVVIIPWRRRTRSRSRVSEARTDGSAAPAASSPDPAAGATMAAGSRGRSLSSERSPGQQGQPTVVPAVSEDPKAKEAAEGQVRPPPRQRSLSRGPDRRTTRAVTPADVQQANSAQDPTNGEGAPRRRRTQSSSRVPSSTANGADAAGTGGAQRPSRRRSSSGTRQPATLPSASKPGDKKEEEKTPAAKESTEEKTTTTASDARENTMAEHKNLPDEGSATGPPRRLEQEGSAKEGKGPIKKRSVLIQTHVIKSASRSCQVDLEAPEKRALDQCK